MRAFLIYIVLTVFINIIANSMPFLVRIAKERVENLIVITSYPATKILTYTQNLVNSYILLTDAQKENKTLKRKLAMCRLYNSMLKKEISEKHKDTFRLLQAPFSFKGNFKTDRIYLRLDKELNLKRDSCVVLSNKLSLIGIIDKKTGKNTYSAKTVFNPSFTADVFILSDNNRFKALFLGNPFLPKVEFLDPNVCIKSGDGVYTSGDFGVYPPGIYIGRVSSVKDVNGYYKLAYLNIDRSFFNSWKVFILCKKK